MDAPLPIRAGVPQDFNPVMELLLAAFHQNPDPELHDVEQGVFEPDRSLVVTDGDRVVGHAGAYTRDLTVPGAVLAAAHVTMVAVAPTHRRRGLLTRLMHRQLRELRDGGEPVAVLWASEGRIYPRYGYGMAAQRLELDVDLRETRVLDPADPSAGPGVGSLRVGDPGQLRPDLAAVYERLRPGRPGWSGRDDRWWRDVLADSPARQSGQTALRVVLHDGPTGPDGYALWRTVSDWDAHGPKGRVRVIEAVAGSVDGYRALWRFLTGIDLSRALSFRFAALDEPLFQLVDEPRQLGAALADSLWVRLVDVAGDGGNDVYLHYSGQNGCRLTFGAHAAAPELPGATGGLLVQGWGTGGIFYSLIADGMDRGKFSAITALLEEQTRTDDTGNRTVMALREATGSALPCA